MKTDINIKCDVEAELRWTPDVDDTEIAVKVNDGVVTLTGFSASYFGKSRAEDAAKRIAGVTGVANEIQVRLPFADNTDDPSIIHAALTTLQSSLRDKASAIKVLASGGHVTLEGELEWHFQRDLAEFAVRHVNGVRSLNNQIQLVPRVQPLDVRHRIEEAFKRSAALDAEAITVSANGGRITLGGQVHSWSERMQAQNTAWAAPGVTEVQNNISLSA